jgi:peroxiredoxin
MWSALNRELSASQSPLVAVYGISLDPEAETRSYIEEHDLLFPVVRFPEAKLARIYRIAGIPTTLVVDHEGVVLHVRRGSLESEAAIDSIRTAALGSAERRVGVVAADDGPR